jgi:hypothetical protein
VKSLGSTDSALRHQGLSGSECTVGFSLVSALVGGERAASRPCCFIPGENAQYPFKRRLTPPGLELVSSRRLTRRQSLYRLTKPKSIQKINGRPLVGGLCGRSMAGNSDQRHTNRVLLARLAVLMNEPTSNFCCTRRHYIYKLLCSPPPCRCLFALPRLSRRRGATMCVRQTECFMVLQPVTGSWPLSSLP